MMFQKYPYEERYRYFQFRRSDYQDGLSVSPPEYLVASGSPSDLSVVCTDKDGNDCSSSMISSVQIYMSTQVMYLLKGGDSGKTYTITIKATTNLGQKLEAVVQVGVI